MRRTCRGRRQKAGRGREREAERARRRLRNRIEDERPGALTRPRRRIARFTVAAGERKAASRSELLPEMEKADAHRSIDPLPAKTGSGEQRAHVTPSLDAEFRPCMPVGERADRRVTWKLVQKWWDVYDDESLDFKAEDSIPEAETLSDLQQITANSLLAAIPTAAAFIPTPSAA